jgi:hypothetical protein
MCATTEEPARVIAQPATSATRERTIVALLAVYAGIQLLVPFRHLLYPGNVDWTEEGHRYSWHMKLRDKQAGAHFFVTDPVSGKTAVIEAQKLLPKWQASKMITRPDLILQFSHYLARLSREKGFENVEVRAGVMAVLNGREPQLLINPKINLAAESRSLRHASWIMPLEEPLPKRKPSGGTRPKGSAGWTDE